jgi:hypothetical protein
MDISCNIYCAVNSKRIALKLHTTDSNIPTISGNAAAHIFRKYFHLYYSHFNFKCREENLWVTSSHGTVKMSHWGTLDKTSGCSDTEIKFLVKNLVNGNWFAERRFCHYARTDHSAQITSFDVVYKFRNFKEKYEACPESKDTSRVGR